MLSFANCFTAQKQYFLNLFDIASLLTSLSQNSRQNFDYNLEYEVHVYIYTFHVSSKC